MRSIYTYSAPHTDSMFKIVVLYDHVGWHNCSSGPVSSLPFPRYFLILTLHTWFYSPTLYLSFLPKQCDLTHRFISWSREDAAVLQPREMLGPLPAGSACRYVHILRPLDPRLHVCWHPRPGYRSHVKDRIQWWFRPGCEKSGIHMRTRLCLCPQVGSSSRRRGGFDIKRDTKRPNDARETGRILHKMQ